MKNEDREWQGAIAMLRGKGISMTGSVHFLDGGGAMAQAIAAHDWSGNELGPPDDWPGPLKIALGLALNSKFPKCLVWGKGMISFPNDAFLPILGEKENYLGASFADIWREAWDEIGPIADRAYAGEATFIEDFPLVIDRYGYPEQCYFTFCYSPLRDEKGVVRGMMDTVIETTGKVEMARQMSLRNGELGHRIKNTLTIVSAIVNQTLQHHEGEGARRVLGQRIGALAQAQALLGQSGSLHTEIDKVVEQALAPFRTGRQRFKISGPSVGLSPRQALTLALALNELATNALKYGALSGTEGGVDLHWTSDPDGMFRLLWTESGGPPVVPAERKGFGSMIIEYALGHDFMGESLLHPEREGIRFELRTRTAHLGKTRGTED